MLGGEQDCYGGCTDPKQGFYGLMDEVRIWNVARSQDEIVSTMRCTMQFAPFLLLTVSPFLATGEMPNRDALIAYWKFDDPGTDEFEQYGTVMDSSGRGNHLDLLVPPSRSDVMIRQKDNHMETGALTFKNNHAFNPNIMGMPSEDITIEFWARSGPIRSHGVSSEQHAEFLSYATIQPGDGHTDNDGGFADSVLIDDAIRIERYLMEYNESQYLRNAKTNTLGSVSVHINSNRQGNGKANDNWLDFATDWYVPVNGWMIHDTTE